MPTIIAGDTRPFTVTLKIGTAVVPLDNGVGDVVTLKFVDPKTKSDITDDWQSVHNDTGANWPQGKVTVRLPDNESAKLDAFDGKDVMLCAQVESATLGKKEFQTTYKIKKGYIP